MTKTHLSAARLIGLVLISALFPVLVAAEGDLIKLQEDPSYCIGLSNNAASGDRLKIVRCNPNDRDHFWLFDNRGHWRPVTNTNLCVSESGSKLRLTTCSSNQRLSWWYNSQGDKEIQNQMTETYCATYDGSSPQVGQSVEMARCNGGSSQGWTFEDGVVGGDYDQIVLRSNPSRCIGVNNNRVSNGAGLVVTRCDARDTTQHWRFSDDRTWRPRRDTDLCVDLEFVQDNEDLNLWRCNEAANRRWYHNENRQSEIAPRANPNLCVARDRNDLLRVFWCRDLSSREKEWDFVQIRN